MTLWSIGHSTRSLDELTAALRAHRIEAVADVRSFPVSARHPQFNRERLADELPKAGIAYHWLGKLLGGYRKKKRSDSPHVALRNQSFRNYADHMETEEFAEGIQELLKLVEKHRAAHMCAERLWWRCHRLFVSDHLTALCEAEVVHILDEKKSEPHRLHRTARVADGRLIYDVGETGRLL